MPDKNQHIRKQKRIEEMVTAAEFYGWGHRQWAEKLLEQEAEIQRLNQAITLRAEGRNRVHLADWNRPVGRQTHR